MSTLLPRIAIVACCKQKADVDSAPARDLYQSASFASPGPTRKPSATTGAFCPPNTSREAGQVIAPYDRSLLSMSKAERRDWADFCPQPTALTWPHGSARFVLLGGAAYGEALDYLAHVEKPFEGARHRSAYGLVKSHAGEETTMNKETEDTFTMEKTIERLLLTEPGLTQEALQRFISSIALTSGIRMGSRKSPSIDHAYHEALREAYVALGGDPKGMY